MNDIIEIIIHPREGYVQIHDKSNGQGFGRILASFSVIGKTENDKRAIHSIFDSIADRVILRLQEGQK